MAVHQLGHITSQATEVEIEHRRDHAFDRKAGTKHVCQTCGESRLHPDHGAFSYNRFGSGSNRFVYQATKKAWQHMFTRLLEDSELPRGCRSIEVFGQIAFPDASARDEDNYRFPYSKFLADALVKGGWLADDDWERFRFRELDRGLPVAGVQVTRLLLLPVYETEAEAA